MIHKAMLEKEKELQRIGRQRDAKNKGTTIQMPTLHMALVEVHKEFARTNRAAKDMAEACKKEL